MAAEEASTGEGAAAPGGSSNSSLGAPIGGSARACSDGSGSDGDGGGSGGGTVNVTAATAGRGAGMADSKLPPWPVFDLYSDDCWKEVGADARHWVRLMLAPMPHLRPGAAALLRSAWLASATADLGDIFEWRSSEL